LDFADHVPKPELGHDAAVRLAIDTPGHQSLGGATFRKARLPIEIDPLDQWDMIDRSEQAAAPEIRSNNLRDPAGRFPVGGAAARKSGSAIGSVAGYLVEIDEEHCSGRVGTMPRDGYNPGCSAEQYGPAARQWSEVRWCRDTLPLLLPLDSTIAEKAGAHHYEHRPSRNTKWEDQNCSPRPLRDRSIQRFKRSSACLRSSAVACSKAAVN
jgi:hypothetical protein